MRIVGGKNRGRALFAPKGLTTRPTSDRTREAVFNILSSRLDGGFSDLTVVDLFSGTGALGLEAISRGAAQALLVDNDRSAIKVIEENINTLGDGESVVLQKRDATKLGALPPQIKPANLVFLDPPYDEGLALPALASLIENKWLTEGALCIVEMAAKENFECPAGFEQLDRRKYGKAGIYILNFTN